jgi:hypothetical protein
VKLVPAIAEARASKLGRHLFEEFFAVERGSGLLGGVGGHHLSDFLHKIWVQLSLDAPLGFLLSASLKAGIPNAMRSIESAGFACCGAWGRRAPKIFMPRT